MTLLERVAAVRYPVVLLAVASMAGCMFHRQTIVPDSLRGTSRAQLIAEANSNYSFGPERNPDSVGTSRVNAPGGRPPGVTMTIATMTRRDGTGRRGSNRFLARITVAGGQYGTLGLAPGVNYVWRDTVNAYRSASRTGLGSGLRQMLGRLTSRGHHAGRMSFSHAVDFRGRPPTARAHGPERTLIVPVNAGYPMKWLAHDANHAPISGGAQSEPVLVMSTNGYGVCDNGCSGGHCASVQASPTAVSDPEPTIAF